MNITIYEHDDYKISGSDCIPAATSPVTNRLRVLRLEHPLHEWTLALHLTGERVDAIHAVLDTLYPPARSKVGGPEPFAPDVERDAASTIRGDRPSSLRPPGISACSATYDSTGHAPLTAAQATASLDKPVEAVAATEQRISDYNVAAVDFVAGKLGLRL